HRRGVRPGPDRQPILRHLQPGAGAGLDPARLRGRRGGRLQVSALDRRVKAVVEEGQARPTAVLAENRDVLESLRDWFRSDRPGELQPAAVDVLTAGTFLNPTPGTFTTTFQPNGLSAGLYSVYVSYTPEAEHVLLVIVAARGFVRLRHWRR